MERAVDVILGASAAVLFAQMVVAMVLPPRRLDGLSWALAALFAVFSAAFALGTFQAFGWLPPLLPRWVRWTLRTGYVITAVVVTIELWRMRLKGKGA